MAVPTPSPDRLQRFLSRRRAFEIGLWVVAVAVQVVANTVVGWMDARRRHLPIAAWEIGVWELSSNLVWLALVPLVLAVLARWPLQWGVWRRHLPLHLAAGLVVSVLHVTAMVGLRKAAYAAMGGHYDFGDWWVEWPYEALKDLRTYALIIAFAMAWHLLVWRLQGEARLLQPADDPPAPRVEEPPQRFLVRKLGTEFLLPVDEVEWAQACGNYVNLRRQGHDYPLRSTLTALEQRLGPGFVRVHRSWLVNLAQVHAIEPTEAGDASVRLKNGAAVPCSRTHLEGLRQRLR